jgi:hydroxybutyrate-dimer hydrolase
VAKRIPMWCISLLAVGCHSSDINTLPAFVRGPIARTVYDGTSGDDLLTGGLGKTGLASATPPPFAIPATPTAAELRARAIYVNYRALVDMTAGGGYGVLWGPNVDVSGNDTLGEGKVLGEEWIAYDDDGTGSVNVTMMVQVPASFDPKNPCIVTGTSSGSRGVYGAIATAGEWGLKHGCAVAYTDKGSGMGVDDLQNNTVNLRDGTRSDAVAAGTSSNFTAQLSDTDRAAFDTAKPNRFAVKHAHSQQNPEKDWGTYTLHAAEFAFYVLNEMFGNSTLGHRVRVIHPGTTIVIASSVSNGGGAALAAAEQDTQALISGVVAGEPQVQVASTATIQRGGATVAAAGKSLYDYTTIASLYQPCASVGPAGTAPGLFNAFGGSQTTAANNRCNTLAAKGLLSGGTTAAQQTDAMNRLHQAGWEPDSDLLHNSHFGLYATPAVAVTYANAYARASVKDGLCGYSFAFVDGLGLVQSSAANAANTNTLAEIFALGNGVPPTPASGSGGINLIDDNSVGPALQDQLSFSNISGSTRQEFNTEGALCLRDLFTGTDVTTGAPLTGNALTQSNALKAGLQEVLRTGKLRGIPAILVQGRSDALVPVNHASRAYFGANKMAEPNSAISYYEIQNAQHFDSFLGLAGFSAHFVPLHPYFLQSMDLMYAALKTGAPIPPSQVVRTTPRGPANISTTNVPPIQASPASTDRITFANGTVSVPN